MSIIKTNESGHWYTYDGKPCHEVMKVDKSGMTPTTLRHAKKMNLVPSVTSILKMLHKPALERYKMEQVALVCTTTPRLFNEGDDAFVKRVLATERQQDQEAIKAAQLGTDIHNAIEMAITGKYYDEWLDVYVEPVMEVIKGHEIVATERILTGDGYAGRCDLITVKDGKHRVWDFKSSKTPPEKSYPEHRLQLAAYGQIVDYSGEADVSESCNIYISTTEPGKITVCDNDSDSTNLAYHDCFKHLVQAWQWMNGYIPKQVY